jgi:hypothetical protein
MLLTHALRTVLDLARQAALLEHQVDSDALLDEMNRQHEAIATVSNFTEILEKSVEDLVQPKEPPCDSPTP